MFQDILQKKELFIEGYENFLKRHSKVLYNLSFQNDI